MTTSPSNDPFFKSPFCAQYWREAKKSLKSLRLLVLAALLVAGRVAITGFPIMVGENLKISFGFFLNALGSLIYGPYVGILTGFATDILGVILHPMGPLFPRLHPHGHGGAPLSMPSFSTAPASRCAASCCASCASTFLSMSGSTACERHALLQGLSLLSGAEPFQKSSHAAGGNCHFADLPSHHAAGAVLRGPHPAPAHQTHPLLGV